MANLISRAAILASILAAGTAFADGQATFYGWANFGGDNQTVSDSAPSIRVAGNPPESALIRSGRWEICSRESFLGRCTVLEPGEYPNLGQQFGYVASAREVGTIPEDELRYRRHWVDRSGRWH